MMAFVFSTTVSRSQAINKQQFTTNENVILALLGDLSRFALFTYEFEDLQLYIEKITEDPHVIKLLVVDRNNKIAVSNIVEEVGKFTPSLQDSKNEYWRIREVKNSSGVLGRVAIQFSNTELTRAKKEVLFVGIRVALIGMTIIAVVGILTGFLLTRRLGVLSKAAQCVKNGNLNVKTHLSGRDELALLGQVFDSMTERIKFTIESLQSRENELRVAHHELERRVDERTSELAIANEELEYLATHDPLTGLPNRSLFLVRLDQAINQAQIAQTNFATVMMDLDRFKEINDTLGHDVGDELLIQVGSRITKALRKSDTVARLGGDEFAIVFSDVNLGEATSLCQKISDKLAEPFNVKNNQFSIGSSQGIAMFPEHANTSTELSKCADIAMYTAKRSRLDHIVYNIDDGKSVVPAMSLNTTLRNAIENDELLLQYQPKVEFQTGNVIGVEALVRWQKDGKLIYPDEFIHYANHTGLINPLSKWVLETAMRQHVKWRDEGIILKVSVNLSAKDLTDYSLIPYITQLLNSYKMESNKLILEIPERCLMADPHGALDVLQTIHDLGIGVSIDDFGTGYSSLIYLNKFPLDEIKIDRSFIDVMQSDRDSLVIVRSVIDLAHNLGILVTAEGVETNEIWETLVSLGCDVSQGFYTGCPMKADELIKSAYSSPQLALEAK